jgi:DNA-binding XRE family transcriptional regulator
VDGTEQAHTEVVGKLEGRRVSGAEIRQAREAKGWTQSRMAYELGTSRRTLVRIETGRMNPPKAIVLAVKYLSRARAS